MEYTNTNQRYNKQYKENTNKRQKFKEKTIFDKCRADGKAYSRNMVAQRSIHFKPTSRINKFLEDCKEVGKDKSKTIREAIELLIAIREDPYDLLSELSLKYPKLWRRVNRRNAQFITQKIQQINNGVENP